MLRRASKYFDIERGQFEDTEYEKVFKQTILDKDIKNFANASPLKVLLNNDIKTDLSYIPDNALIFDSFFENYYESVGYEERGDKYIRFEQTFNTSLTISANRMFYGAHLREFYGKSFDSLILCESMFEDCVRMKVCEISFGNNVKSFRRAFFNCKSLKFIDINIKDCSQIQSFQQMFSRTPFKNLSMFSSWNVSTKADFSKMFSDCDDLVDCSGIDSWDLSENETAKTMFEGCENIKRYPKWFH